MSMEEKWMSKRGYEEIKESFKKDILEMEQELLKDSNVVAPQVIVTKIVKNYEKINDELMEALKNEN